MTNDILQSDIDLARRLLDAGRPASEVVAALGHRGIESPRATQLVADLQAGKRVEPDQPIKISLPSKTSNPTISSGPEPLRQPSPGDSPGDRPQYVQSRKQSRGGFPWFTIIALASVAVCITAFVTLSRKSHKTGIDPAKSESGKIEQHQSLGALEPKGISLEIQPDGLRLCGNRVSHEQFLADIFKTLGPPARTNQVEEVDHVIYAYDAYGLLVYSPKNLGRHFIVLDFEATDGAAGTKTPFRGKFQINDELVRSDTDAATLGKIKDLGLQAPITNAGIFRAQYANLELLFGYLKSPERLSLVEIDFK